MIRIYRAQPSEVAPAFAINTEYMDAVGVIVRDDPTTFLRYFGPRTGFWLAEDGNEVVGCIALHALSSDTCEVKRLYVRPPWRRQGLADRLLDALETFAVQMGYRLAFLDTKEDLHSAIRFYERRGYERCPRYNDNPQATIFMRRSLPAPAK